MRRELAPIGHWIAANGGDNEKTLSLDPWRGKGLGFWQSLWGAIGSLAALTTSPGGVQIPCAPFPLLYSPLTGDCQ